MNDWLDWVLNVECIVFYICIVVVVIFVFVGFMMWIKMGGIKKVVKEVILVISVLNNMLCDYNLLRSIIKWLIMKEIFKMVMFKNMDFDYDFV